MTTVEVLETDLITTPEEAPAGRPARTEKTDDELLTEYGALLWSALQAFGTDPGYFETMCNAAYRHEEFLDMRVRAARLARLCQRLRGKVEVQGECWTWTGAATKGTPTMKRPGTQRTTSARAWTVEQWHGEDSTRWMVRASCGNTLCVSPLHASWRHVEGRR